MENTIKLLPRFTETLPEYDLVFIHIFDPIDDRTPEYKGHDEEWEWKQLAFNPETFNYSEHMEYDSMINEQEFDRIDKQLTSQDRIDMGIDTDLPF